MLHSVVLVKFLIHFSCSKVASAYFSMILLEEERGPSTEVVSKDSYWNCESPLTMTALPYISNAFVM